MTRTDRYGDEVPFDQIPVLSIDTTGAWSPVQARAVTRALADELQAHGLTLEWFEVTTFGRRVPRLICRVRRLSPDRTEHSILPHRPAFPPNREMQEGDEGVNGR